MSDPATDYANLTKVTLYQAELPRLRDSSTKPIVKTDRNGRTSTLLSQTATLLSELARDMDRQPPINDSIEALTMLANERTEINWRAFSDYLRSSFSADTVDLRMLYAEKYSNLLTNGDLSPLLAQTAQTRLNIMKSLATLSKFLGCYEEWSRLKKSAGLTWTDPDATLKAFEKITAEEIGNIDDMQKWVSLAVEKLPRKYGNLIKFNVQTGLRPTESLASIRLFHAEPGVYVSKKHNGAVLEHVKYPKIFLRRTKKAFVSVITDSMRQLAQEYDGYMTYQALRMKLRKLGLPTKLEYCRQIYSTTLRQAGIDVELIDLMQGRLPAKVFLRHYYRPNFNQEIERIKTVIELKL